MTKARPWTPALILVLAVTAGVHASPCGEQASMVTEFGKYRVWSRMLPPGSVLVLPEDQDVRYLRILLRSKSNDAWKVTIRDRQGRPLQSLSNKDTDPGASFWTDRLPTHAVELHADPSAVASPVLETLEYVAVPKAASKPYYSVQGDQPAWRDLYADSAVETWLQRRGESVGMLVARDGDSVTGIKLWSCSGFVVRNDPEVLFATNDHCGSHRGEIADRWSDQVCTNLTIDFSWDGDSVSREYRCDKIRARSSEFDLALIRIRPLRPEPPPPALNLGPEPAHNETAFIIHHPAADMKKLSSCSPITVGLSRTSTVKLDRDFAHRCDTEGGTSGAPVLNSEGQVIGVHHLGFEKDANGQCDRLNKAARVTKLKDLLANISR